MLKGDRWTRNEINTSPFLQAYGASCHHKVRLSGEGGDSLDVMQVPMSKVEKT